MFLDKNSTRNKGAKTLASNAFRVGALAMVGGLTLFLGKCLVAICSGVCAGLMVRNFPDHPEGTSFYTCHSFKPLQ